MSFHRDEKYAARLDHIDRFMYGDYLVTYTSPQEQVRAQLFRKTDGKVVAHVTDLSHRIFRNVTDSFVTDIEDYARQNGFADRLQVILVEA